MTFDGTIHLGDVVMAGTVLGGGIVFLVNSGTSIQRLTSAIENVLARLSDHEKRLDRIDDRFERRLHERP